MYVTFILAISFNTISEAERETRCLRWAGYTSDACMCMILTCTATFNNLLLLLTALSLVQDDATEAEWYDVTKLPPMAFDHKLIVRTAFEHLLQQSETKSVGARCVTLPALYASPACL